MIRYKNPWHQPAHPIYGPEFFETSKRPASYRGYLIFHRLDDVFDIVRDGACVGQCAGPNGARRAVDQMIAKPGRYAA